MHTFENLMFGLLLWATEWFPHWADPWLSHLHWLRFIFNFVGFLVNHYHLAVSITSLIMNSWPTPDLSPRKFMTGWISHPCSHYQIHYHLYHWLCHCQSNQCLFVLCLDWNGMELNLRDKTHALNVKAVWGLRVHPSLIFISSLQLHLSNSLPYCHMQ